MSCIFSHVLIFPGKIKQEPKSTGASLSSATHLPGATVELVAKLTRSVCLKGDFGDADAEPLAEESKPASEEKPAATEEKPKAETKPAAPPPPPPKAESKPAPPAQKVTCSDVRACSCQANVFSMMAYNPGS